MSKLDSLPEITENALFGLVADSHLKNRILLNSTNAKIQRNEKMKLRLVPVLVSSVAVMILSLFLLNGKKLLMPSEKNTMMNNFSAGSSNGSAYSIYANNINSSFSSFLSDDLSSIAYVEWTSCGKITDAETCKDLISILKTESVCQNESKQSDYSDDLLIIRTTEGITYRFKVEKPMIVSDGLWNCPAFFEKFENSVN